MQSLVVSVGEDVLDQLIEAAESLGCTEYIQPSSVTYRLGPRISTSYDPDTGYSYGWTSTYTISNVLVGGFNWRVIANTQNVEESDVQVLFKQSEIATAPTDDDECVFNSETYEYKHHRAAADLFLIHMRLKTGAA